VMTCDTRRANAGHGCIVYCPGLVYLGHPSAHQKLARSAFPQKQPHRLAGIAATGLWRCVLLTRDSATRRAARREAGLTSLARSNLLAACVQHPVRMLSAALNGRGMDTGFPSSGEEGGSGKVRPANPGAWLLWLHGSCRTWYEPGSCWPPATLSLVQHVRRGATAAPSHSSHPVCAGAGRVHLVGQELRGDAKPHYCAGCPAPVRGGPALRGDRRQQLWACPRGELRGVLAAQQDFPGPLPWR